MNSKVIVILSDALRYDYPKNHQMKFLEDKISDENTDYIEKIVPSIGFCEISEYVAGLPVEEHKLLTQITVRGDWASIKEEKSLKLLDCLNKIPKRIPIINRISNKAVDRLLLQKGIASNTINVRYNIPLSFLPFIGPTESDFEYDQPDFYQENNFFVWLKQQGINYDIEDFVKHNKICGTDYDRFKRLNAKIVNKQFKDFTLLYIGFGEQAHFLGTESKKFTEKMQEYSKLLEHTVKLLEQQKKPYQIIILGDHGMVDVNNYISVRPLINQIEQRYNISLYRDYMYFVDSTMLRVWLNNKQQIKDIARDIEEYLSPHVERGETIQNVLPRFMPTYGDIICLLKPGNVFYPDFFNIRKIKAMHGYSNKYPEQFGLLIGIGNNMGTIKEKERPLADVQSYLKNKIIGN